MRVNKSISLIIPHHNDVFRLSKLLKQISKFEKIQIIVIDDNSTINLQELNDLINKYPLVKFIRNTSSVHNAGRARNMGLKEVQTKWVMFADSDDSFTDDFEEILTKYIYCDTDVIYFQPIVTEKDSDVPSKKNTLENLITDFLENKNQNTEYNLRYKFMPPWSKLINTEFLNQNDIRFDEVQVSNDVMFSTKVGHFAKSISVEVRPIYIYKSRTGSLMTFSIEKKLIRSKILADNLSFIQINKKSNLTLEFVENNEILLNLAVVLWQGKKIEYGIQYFNFFKNKKVKIPYKKNKIGRAHV